MALSDGYYEKRKRHLRLVISICTGTLVLILSVALFIYFFGKEKEADYGKVLGIDNKSKNVMETEREEKEIPLTVTVLNVGDALSVFIDYGSCEILYDCAGKANSKKVLKGISGKIEGELDYLIISHSHEDHCGGTAAVLNSYNAGTIITSGEGEGAFSKEAEDAIKEAKASGSRVLEDADMTFDLGEGCTLNIIETLDAGDNGNANANNLSVIAYIKREGDSILLTGDAEKEAEKMLLGKIKDVSLYIAGHHMSNTSSNEVLLSQWNPKVIIASCAGPKASQYGYPHRAALRRCLIATSSVYGTYLSGNIKAELGGEIKITQEKKAQTISLD